MSKNENKCSSCIKWARVLVEYEINNEPTIVAEGVCIDDEAPIRYGYYGILPIKDICNGYTC